MMSTERVYDLEERLIEFASKIVDTVESLPNSKAGNYIERNQSVLKAYCQKRND